MGVPSPQPQPPHQLFDGVLEDVSANRKIVEPTSERPPRRFVAPITGQKRRLMFRLQHRQPADIASPAVDTQPPAGPRAIEVDQKKVDRRVGLDHQDIPH